MENSKETVKISVVIPTYNRSDLITRAIDSVLHQTLPPLEIIVVDDGSKDDTKEVLNVYGDRIQYTWQSNGGVSSARNKGIEMAKGNYIAFLDSDDYWIEEKLELQVQFLNTFDVPIIITDASKKRDDRVEETSFDKCLFNDALLSGVPVKDLTSMLLEQNFIKLSTVLIRKDCFKKIGLFDENLSVAEDTDLWMRLSVYYTFGILDKITVIYYSQGDNLSADFERQLQGRIIILKKLLSEEDSIRKYGKENLIAQKNRKHGSLIFYYVQQGLFGKIVNHLITHHPGYLFSKMFYKGIYWDFKVRKKRMEEGF